MMRTVALSDLSAVGVARRAAAETARSVGFTDSDVERAALIATELGTNVIRHGGGGELLIGLYEDMVSAGVELVALDRGPGMANVEACMRDGFSTAGSAGNGLGAVARLSTAMDIWSRPDAGAVVLARIQRGRPGPATPERLAWGALLLPKPGEEACGDGWCAADAQGHPAFMVVDGIGHGPLAADAAKQAVRLFRQHAGRMPSAILQALHAGLGGTRGAAGAVARIDLQQKTMAFAGIGNIAAGILSGGEFRRTVSLSGILGGSVRKIQDFTYPAAPPFLLIMHSDGLGTNWALDAYPGLTDRHPMLIAAMFYRDFRRGRDDTTVLVVKGR